MAITATSCTDSEDWTPGENDTEVGVAAYFEIPAKTSYIFESDAAADAMIIPVTVARELTTEAVTMAINIAADGEGVSAPATVEFAAGQQTATFDIDCSGITKGQRTTITVGLPADQTDIYGQGYTSLTLSAIKSDWTLISDNVRYLYSDSNYNPMYPATTANMYHLEGTYMFKLDDFFGSGLDMTFECGNAQESVFRPLINADFESAAGEEDSPWYLYDDDKSDWPIFVPGKTTVEEGDVAIQFLEFFATSDYSPCHMIYTPSSLFGYIAFSTYVEQTDGNWAWGNYQIDFNLKYNPFEK